MPRCAPMVTEDPKGQTAALPGATEPDPPRRSLAELIARSPQGIEPARIVAWACQVAAELDSLHDSSSCHGNVDARSIEIGPDGTARLARAEPGGDERGLLLGALPGAARRDVHDLAAATYQALSGSPPGDDPSPIPGVTVQVNLALLAALGRDAAARPATAGQLASMLRGGPVAVRSRPRAPRAALSAATAVGCMAIAAALWWWIESPADGPLTGSAPAPAPTAPSVVQPTLAGDAPASALAQELRAVESRLRADTARRRWEATAAQCPAILSEDLRVVAANLAAAASSAAVLMEQGGHEQAQHAFEHAADGLCRLLEDDRDVRLAADSAWEAWEAALRAAPPAWSDDVARETAAAAQALAAEAEEACQAGRFRSAAPLYQQAAARMGEATLRDPAPAPDPAPGVVDAAKPAPRTTSLAGAAAVAGVAPPAPLAPPVAPSGARAVLVNSLSQTLVYIVPGAFRMGCDPGDDGADTCGPRHSVQLRHGFYLGRVEVTRGQFAAFVGAAGYLTTAERAGWALGLDESGRWQRVPGMSWRNPGFTQTDSHPVVCVSADDTEAFCLWIGGREGRRYRLPTEAEWEYACRAGGLTAWSWGDSPTAAEPRCNGADAAWVKRFPGSDAFDWNDDHCFTGPVAAFTANDWGLFDMHGNVQEWCQDAYAPYSGEDAVDPVAAASESSGAIRVLRGGSFASAPTGCRAAQRDAAPPDASLVTTGFRVVMDP